MRHLPIARSLRLALVALTVVLAVIAALGISSLYAARQHYENTLISSSSLSTAAANLAAAGIVEEEVLRDARGPAAASERARAQATYRADAALARRLAAGDPQSEHLVAAEIAAQAQARALANRGQFAVANVAGGPLFRTRALAASVQDRQRSRQREARSKARSDSRRALILIAVAGALALFAALALIAAIVRGLRRPLHELLAATSDLAAGRLDRRVSPSGPRELVELGSAFNTMAGDLALAQQRIEQERHRLAVTIQSLGDGLIVTDPDRVTIRTVNPRAAELVPELVPGEHVDGPESPLPELSEAMAGEAVVEHRERTLAITAAPLAANGTDASDTGIVWTIRDTTERARLERAKSEFVATASHELRSPLTSIKGFVELLQRSPGSMSARQREFVQIIMRSTDRLVDLVNDLLDVARIEANYFDVTRRAIDVAEPVREVVELIGPRIAEKQQQLSTYIAPDLPRAYADPGRIRQIVANLITNAHIYTPSEGKIDVSVDRVDERIQITVSDSGIGMTREQLEHVFDRFYRASGQTTPGTGLGLSIVKSLVDMHEGEVQVESEAGRGTIFRVSLPVAVPEPEAPEQPEELRGRRVLIVDDERDIAELIARQLKPLAVQSTIVTNGQEALEKLRSGEFDAVTLDVLMPEMDGLETLRQIRSDPQLRATPIVFVSVFSGRSELAGERVVSKPIDADELRRVVGGAVRAGRSSVLVVGREELRPALEPALEELGIDHVWELDGAESVARACAEHRFEVAVVDAGLPDPKAVLDAIDLRGRRLRQAVILFSDGAAPAPPGVTRLGLEVVPVDKAATALMAVMEGQSS
jgi:signal transduction histidine kinase/CheY-like chemotaxis protein/HAMP domain-containing protein